MNAFWERTIVPTDRHVETSTEATNALLTKDMSVFGACAGIIAGGGLGIFFPSGCPYFFFFWFLRLYFSMFETSERVI